MGNIGGMMSTDEGTDAERRPHSVAPGPPCYAFSEGRSTPIAKGCDGPKAMEGSPPVRSPGFPLSHLLDFGAEARAERHGLSTRLSSEVGVPFSTALAALETFGLDVTKARRWLQNSQHAKEVRFGLVNALVLLNSPYRAITVVEEVRFMHSTSRCTSAAAPNVEVEKSHLHCCLAC